MTDYRAMSSDSEISDFQRWDEDKLGLYFRKRGLGEYCEVLKKHKITGGLGKYCIFLDSVGMGESFKNSLIPCSFEKHPANRNIEIASSSYTSQ